MPPIYLNLPLAQFISQNEPPLTRERVIELAQLACKGTAREINLRITVDDEYDGQPIELATVELIPTPGGGWRLQYVSHPAQSYGLTEAIVPCASDFAAFLTVHAAEQQLRPLTPVCAEELDAEGLGPFAALDLRNGNSAPVVPSRNQLMQLLSMVRCPADLAPILALPIQVV